MAAGSQGVELANAWVTILPSMAKMGPALNTGLQAPMADAGKKSGGWFGSALMGGVTKVVKGASIGATIFGAVALKSGLDRLTTIQNATTSLTTIMGDAGKAAALMGEIKKTVQGTPFNLDQFADAGKNLVAMNIAGSKVPGILTAIGDAAATSGKGAEGVSQLVDTFGKMAAQGQVSLDQIWSISSTGVPALQILANGFGKTTDDMKSMISEGSVPATKAIDILTKGIEDGSKGAAGATIGFGGAMAGLRKTFTGAFGGMKAAVARFGAAALQPFLGLMTSSATGAGEFLDNVAKRMAPVMQSAANSVSSLMVGLTGAQYTGVGKPLDTWVAKGETVRRVIGRVKDGAVGLYDFIVHGDFTGAFSRAFGVQEDSPVVDYMFKIRDAVGDVVASFRSVDFSSVQSATSGVGAAFGQIGGIFTTVKENADVLKPAVQDLGTAMAGAAAGGGVILANLLHIASGAVAFFADHTGLATAAILAMTASMAAAGPINNAYKLAIIVRTPLIALQTAASVLNSLALRANTKVIAANTIATDASSGAAKKWTATQILLHPVTATRTLLTYLNTQATNANAAATGRASLMSRIWGNTLKFLKAALLGVGKAMVFLFTTPMGLIILGIAAVVAGLVLFFTKTETGRAIITAVWSGIQKVVGKVVGWFVRTAWPAMQAVWEGIAAGAKWLWRNVLRPVFDSLKQAWSLLWRGFKSAWAVGSAVFSTIGKIVYAILGGAVLGTFLVLKAAWGYLWTAVKWAWSNVGKPVFDGIAAVVGWLWRNVVGPVVAGLKLEFQLLWAAVQWAWSNVGRPVFDAIGAAISWVWTNVIQPAWVATKLAFDLLWSGVTAAWTNVGKPVFDAIGTAISWVWKNVVKPTFDAISSAWSTLWGGLKDAFSSVWGGVKNAIVAGVNGVIGIINGFLGGINAILSKLPGDFKIGLIPTIGGSGANGKAATDTSGSGKSGGRAAAGFAAGGTVHGPGTGTSDSIWARLSNGEHVTKERQASKYPRLLTAINSGTYDGPDLAPGYASGGFVDTMFRTVAAAFPEANLNSGYRPGANDYHGRGQAVDLGKRGVAGGAGNSYLAAMNTWIYDKFGKGTAELIYDGLGDNRPDLKNGAAHNYGPALQAQHRNHVHWALNSLAALTGAGAGAAAGGGAGGGFSLTDPAAVAGSAFDALVGPVNALIGKLPDGLVKSFTSGAVAKVGEAVKGVIGKSLGGGTKTSGGTGLDAWIAQAMGIAGVPASWSGGLRTLIMRESGGNPFAINNSDVNARNGDPSRGLMQTIGATFEQYRDKSLINDIFDPVANIVAGINYIKARYGDISKVQQANPDLPPKGYDQGGLLRPGASLVMNRTGVPEAVLNPSQWQAMYDIADDAGPDDDLREEIAGLRRDLVAVGAEIADRNDAGLDRQTTRLKQGAANPAKRGPR